MAIFFLIAAFVLVIVAYVVVMRAGGFRFPYMHFYVRGKESGFSFKEINLLRRVAIQNRLKNPTSLFWSVKTLDRCIRSAIVGFRASGQENNPKNLEFLNKLFDFRRRVEFDQPKYRLGLTSTRGIAPGQTFKFALEGGGIYIAKLIENNRRHLAVTYPRGNSTPPGFSWRNEDLRVYFWRAEDAGYYFETKVVGDYIDRKVPILHISHAENLVRAQKRGSVRREANTNASLYPLKTIDQANEGVETRGGYRCKLLDISEDGAAVVIGGRAKAGLPVKIQSELGGDVVVLSGIVKSVNFKQKTRASILHIQARTPTVPMRVKILTFVYGLFDEAESRSTLKRHDPDEIGDKRPRKALEVPDGEVEEEKEVPSRRRKGK